MIRSFCLALIVGTSVTACAGSPSSDEGAAEESALAGEAPSAVRFGTYEYRFRPIEGRMKRLVLRADGTFERAEWAKTNGRLGARTVKGTFVASQKQVPQGTAYRLKFTDADGSEKLYRYAYQPSTALEIMADREGAPRTDLQMFEAADGRKAASADCRVVKVYDYTVFEESLSEEEYPNVDFYKSPDQDYAEVGFGGSPYSTADGDKITVTTSGARVDVRVDQGDGDYRSLSIEGRDGEIRARDRGNDVLIAKVSCKAQR